MEQTPTDVGVCFFLPRGNWETSTR